MPAASPQSNSDRSAMSVYSQNDLADTKPRNSGLSRGGKFELTVFRTIGRGAGQLTRTRLLQANAQPYSGRGEWR
jgi:hypothetical protein